ncbi:MAG TPA: hypothetical protein PLJ60_21590 [Chryseolinea sp.]|nr:hypothetical protein [Chryseolinea sp.]
MKKFSPLLFITIAILFQRCQNLEDAPIDNRNTFMHFYEGGNSYVASAAEITSDGGFIIIGTITVIGDVNESKMVIIKTDRFGQRLYDETIIDGGTSSSVMETNNGYIVLGDSIQFNLNSERTSDLVNNWSRMVTLNAELEVQTDRSFALSKDDPNDPNDFHVDFHAKSITKDNQGNLITLGSFRVPGATENSFIAALDAITLDTIWREQYNYIDRNYTLAKGMYYNPSGNIMWASSLTITQGVFNKGYVTIPVVKDSSTFVNSDYYGEISDRTFILNDLRPAAIGYCAIGTISPQAEEKKGNLFFIKVDNNGNFKPGSAKYFDGVLSENNTSLDNDSTETVSDDTGDAITSTKDGGYLLGGTLTTTPQRGNGGKDIWLIRLDAEGKVLWNKIIGGSTDETIASIRETSDGGFLICGSKSFGVGGQSSIMLIKTDKNGELRN